MKYVPLYLAALMLICLAPMPYGYFTLVRVLAMVVFCIYAYKCYKVKKDVWTWTFVTLALLFQPFAKIALDRLVWNVIDVIVAIGLIGLFFWERNERKKIEKENKPIPPIDSLKIEEGGDNRIEFTLDGKLDSKELIYVASEEDKELTDLLENNPEVFEGWGQMIGFHVIYLPLLMKRLAQKEVLQYRAPYLSNTELGNIKIGNDFMLQFLENPTDRQFLKHGFLRTENIQRKDGKDKAINRFYPLSSDSSEPIADQLHRISKQIACEKSLQRCFPTGTPSDTRYSRLEHGTSILTGGVDSLQAGDDVDDLLEEVRMRIYKLRQRGISQYILEQLIHPDDRLSRLVITSDYSLLLPDYNNMEIKMEPLVKSVYLLFLKHPEGIVFKNLPDYRQELTKIYSEVRTWGLTERAIQSIEDVTNPLLNSINEKCARIRGAFLGQFDDRMAKHYYITGGRGEAKKITLPRDLVIWE